MMEILAGYSRWNKRNFGKLEDEEVSADAAVPDMDEEEQAALQAHMRGYYGAQE